MDGTFRQGRMEQILMEGIASLHPGVLEVVRAAAQDCDGKNKLAAAKEGRRSRVKILLSNQA